LLTSGRVQGPTRVRAIRDKRGSGAAWATAFRQFRKERAPQLLKEAGNERCMYIMREKADGSPVDLDVERGITLEEGEKLTIIVMNTDDMLIAYSKNAKSFVDNFEQILNESFEATLRERPSTTWACISCGTRGRERGLLGFDTRRHVYNFIWQMERDPESFT
jgi:hypothetical protein